MRRNRPVAPRLRKPPPRPDPPPPACQHPSRLVIESVLNGRAPRLVQQCECGQYRETTDLERQVVAARHDTFYALRWSDWKPAS